MADEKSEFDLLQELITKTEEDFEKKILYIGAGTLLLSLTLLEKIIQLENSSGTAILIIGWSCLVGSILLNLASQPISKSQLRQAQQDIIDKVGYDVRYQNYKKRLRKIENINWFSIGLLIFGICMILIFASVNATYLQKPQVQTILKKDTVKVQIINLNQYPMPQEEKKSQIQTEGRTEPRPFPPDIEKKGITVPMPKESTTESKPVEQPTTPPSSEE